MSRHYLNFDTVILQYPLCNSSHVFRAVYHGFKRPIDRLPQHVSPPPGPLRIHHDHMFGVLGRIPTLASRFVDSGEFSSVKMRVEPDVLAANLDGDTALGPWQVLVYGCWHFFKVKSLSACFVVWVIHFQSFLIELWGKYRCSGWYSLQTFSRFFFFFNRRMIKIMWEKWKSLSIERE